MTSCSISWKSGAAAQAQTRNNLFLGNYALVWFGIAYQLVWFAVFVTLAARVFSSDRILTMKLSLGRKKR